MDTEKILGSVRKTHKALAQLSSKSKSSFGKEVEQKNLSQICIFPQGKLKLSTDIQSSDGQEIVVKHTRRQDFRSVRWMLPR